MADPTDHLISLQRTLEINLEEKRRLQSELEVLERKAALCRVQIRAADRMINQTTDEMENSIGASREHISGRYEPQISDSRGHERYDQRYPQRREPREPRYAPREEERYEQRYERPGYREVDPYRASTPRPVRSHDARDPNYIDDALENLHRVEEGSNVRFADFRIPQAATIVLREANEALHVSEIFRRMAEGGFEFRGQHQQITLAVSLSRSNRFRKVAPGTFELDPAYRAGQVA